MALSNARLPSTSSRCHETADVFRSDLNPQGCAERIDAMLAQVLIEVPAYRRPDHRLDPDASRQPNHAVWRAIFTLAAMRGLPRQHSPGLSAFAHSLVRDCLNNLYVVINAVKGTAR